MFRILFAIAFVTGSSSAETQFLVKYDNDAANGRCLTPLTEHPDVVFRRNNIQIEGDVEVAELQALAEVVTAVEKIGDGGFSLHRNARFRFGNVWGVSRYRGGVIQINPGRQSSREMDDKRYGGRNNRALLAHELGHYVGQRGPYRAYLSAVPRRDGTGCMISGYASKRRTEEFAEVFAAFVTNRNLFKDKGLQCTDAFSFMIEAFGAEGGLPTHCDGEPMH